MLFDNWTVNDLLDFYENRVQELEAENQRLTLIIQNMNRTICTLNAERVTSNTTH